MNGRILREEVGECKCPITAHFTVQLHGRPPAPQCNTAGSYERPGDGRPSSGRLGGRGAVRGLSLQKPKGAIAPNILNLGVWEGSVPVSASSREPRVPRGQGHSRQHSREGTAHTPGPAVTQIPCFPYSGYGVHIAPHAGYSVKPLKAIFKIQAYSWKQFKTNWPARPGSDLPIPGAMAAH